MPSPTRDKLMPTIPRSREGSPKKSITSRHGSPQKGSPQKGSPKKLTKVAYKGRSQSLGPTGNSNDKAPVVSSSGAPVVVNNNADHSVASTTSGSPKRQVRSAAGTAGKDLTHSGTANKTHKDKVPVMVPVSGERRPRPSKCSLLLSLKLPN